MKKIKLALIALVAFTCSAKATLIDLTPKGFSTSNAPPAFYQFLYDWNVTRVITFFDSAMSDGFVSQYGSLNGGIYFTTSMHGTPSSVTASWNFSALAGWSMCRILLEGQAADGSAWDNLYSVPANLAELDQLETLLIGEGIDIYQISFYGRTPWSPVPDSGSTLLMLGASLACLMALRRKTTT